MIKPNTKIISVAAVPENGVIGVREFNEMPWRLGEFKGHPFWDNMRNENSFRRIDMAKFQELTIGENYAVFMGRLTRESIPPRAWPLSDRVNIVMRSTTPEEEVMGGVVHFNDLDAAVASFDQYGQVAIMGGAGIYERTMPIADELYLTRIHRDFEGDVHFPKVEDTEWQLQNRFIPQLVPEFEQYQGIFSFEKWVRR